MAWFNDKFFEEASNPLVTERIYKRFMNEEDGGGAPAADVIRAAKANVRYHLAYIGWLARTRNFLAGDRLTYADLAAAAHLSAIDYLGDVPWIEDDAAKAWYARVKSRPSFRPLLSEWLAGVPASRDLCGPGLLNAYDPSSSCVHDGRRLPAGPRLAGSEAAMRCGFDCIGVSRSRLRSRDGRPRTFSDFSNTGAHGDMDWLAADPRAPRRSARAVAGRALGHHARRQLRARRGSAGDPAAAHAAARSRSMRRATTITT